MGRGLPMGGEWSRIYVFLSCFQQRTNPYVPCSIWSIYTEHRRLWFSKVSLEGVPGHLHFEESLLKACLAFQAVFLPTSLMKYRKTVTLLIFCLFVTYHTRDIFLFQKSGIKNIVTVWGFRDLLKLLSFKCSDYFNIWVFDIVPEITERVTLLWLGFPGLC